MCNYLTAQAFLETTDSHIGYATNLHPLVIVMIGMIIGAMLVFILLIVQYNKRRKKDEAEVEKITKSFLAQQMQTEAVLHELDFGVLAFGNDGKVRLSNGKLLELLNIKKLPENIAEFLSFFGEENGLKASALLGTGHSEANVEVNQKTIRILMKDSSIENSKRFATLVLVTDISEEVELDKQRKEFVANVSHELKTPLTIIKTYSESLLDWGLDEKSNVAVKADLQRILDDVTRMEALISDLLLLSSIDSNGKSMHMKEQDLAVVVRSVVDRCQMQAKVKEIDLRCYVLSELPNVFIDRSSMDRVFMNIIQNAIKYTDQNGKIDVYITRIREDIMVKVKDNGQGIDPKFQKAIFDRFYRVDNTGSRKYGGTGLGLSIAKELCEIHHGKINVSSVLTKGSEFSVTLPTVSKVYRRIMLSVIELDNAMRSDVLYKQAAKELLQKAANMGMPAETLEDLTRQEREQLLAPYEKEEDLFDSVDEDFAGVLRKPEDSSKPTERVEVDTPDEEIEVSANNKDGLDSEYTNLSLINHTDNDVDGTTTVSEYKNEINEKLSNPDNSNVNLKDTTDN